MTQFGVVSPRHVPLHRLIKPREAETLLGAFQALLPGADLALIRLDGRLFAGTGEWSQWKASLEDPHLLIHPLRVHAQPVGALVARHVEGASTQEAALRALHHSLTLLLAQAMDKRDLAGEALERYREINLLYHISETIGACLNPADIPPFVLAEACRIIQADAAAVLLPAQEPEGDLRAQASFGESGSVALLHEISRGAIDQALQVGRPVIVTWEALRLRSGQASPDAERPIPFGAVLCAPLKTEERAIGVILMGRLAGAAEFVAGDEKLLMALASQAAIAIEKARLHIDEIKRQRLEEELSVGRRLQLSLLPNACPTIPGWEFAAVYQAARQIGGDLYDFFELPGEPRRLGMVIADVTGKGVAAALFMAVCRTVMRMEAVTGSSPATALERANRFIVRDFRSALLLSAFYATLDPRSGELVYANGGHNWPLWLRVGSGRYACSRLSARGIVLGAFESIELEEWRIEVAPGDVLVFYTDGVTEAKDARGGMFDERRLQAILMAHCDASAEAVARAIVDAVQAFVGDTPQSDDLTLFVVKRQVPASSAEAAPTPPNSRAWEPGPLFFSSRPKGGHK